MPLLKERSVSADRGTGLNAISERGAYQRAQRRGLSLRKQRFGVGTRRHVQYWLVVPGTNNVVAGGDSGLSLENIATWLSSTVEL
jgi:hypothetical protein